MLRLNVLIADDPSGMRTEGRLWGVIRMGSFASNQNDSDFLRNPQCRKRRKGDSIWTMLPDREWACLSSCEPR
jgi:hypothetical protein